MIVNAVWIGDEFPLLQRVCANSWIAHGHEYNLWLYGNTTGIPPNVFVYDALSILPGPIRRYTDRKHSGSPILHANLFRYAFLMQRGGAFIDADTLCLAPFDLSGRYAFSTEGQKQHPNFAFVNVPRAGTDFAIACHAEACVRLSDTPSWGKFGPALLKEQIEAFGLTADTLNWDVFCPLFWSQTDQLFVDPPPNVNGSLGVHLWQQVITKRGTNLGDSYSPGCLWERWKTLYA